MTTDLLRVDLDDGTSVVVEVDDREPGFVPVGRGDVIAEARSRFEAALSQINTVAHRTLATLRDGRLKPDGVEMEFGIRFNAEAGAVIAKTAAEAHLVVRLTWSSTGPAAAPAE